MAVKRRKKRRSTTAKRRSTNTKRRRRIGAVAAAAPKRRRRYKRPGAKAASNAGKVLRRRRIGRAKSGNEELMYGFAGAIAPVAVDKILQKVLKPEQLQKVEEMAAKVPGGKSGAMAAAAAIYIFGTKDTAKNAKWKALAKGLLFSAGPDLVKAILDKSIGGIGASNFESEVQMLMQGVNSPNVLPANTPVLGSNKGLIQI